ncbi:MAG: hypothetical protein WBX20_13355 [Terrimicrobiaceae bacterium]
MAGLEVPRKYGGEYGARHGIEARPGESRLHRSLELLNGRALKSCAKGL